MLNIVELPVGKWTRLYKNYLEEYFTDKDKEGVLENLKEYHTINRVNFELKFFPGVLKDWENNLISQLKLVSSISTNNMVLFNSEGRLTRFKSVQDILQEFYTVRLKGYSLRKEYLLSKLKYDLQVISNKLRFVKEIIEDELEIRKVPMQKLCATLLERGYARCRDFIKIKSNKINEKAKQK